VFLIGPQRGRSGVQPYRRRPDKVHSAQRLMELPNSSKPDSFLHCGKAVAFDQGQRAL
jgi:hypothetical protein